MVESLLKLSKIFLIESSKEDISPELQYHIDNNIPIYKNVFRVGSQKFCDMFNELRKLASSPIDEKERYYLNTDIGEFADFENKKVPLDLPFIDEPELDVADVNDASDKKDPPLNKPKRGGPKKFYVYVRDPKTKNIKKVTFGDPGMSVGVSDPKRRKSFKERHKCEQKNDKTTPGYWSCRIGRYPHLTGSKQKFTWW